MADVFICHRPEDRPAFQRLASALRSLGLSVAGDGWGGHLAVPSDRSGRDLRAARAILVLWSKTAIGSEDLLADAVLALELDAVPPAKTEHRYLGLTIDGVAMSELPSPFNAQECVDWTAGLTASAMRLDDPSFVRFLSTLEAITGRSHLTEIASAIAARDHEVERLQRELQGRDELLSAAQARAAGHAENLEQCRSELAAAVEQHADLERKKVSLEAEHGALTVKLIDLETRLREEQSAVEVARSTLETASRTMRDTQAAKSALEADLENARAELAASHRQQKTLQAQIQADDQSIREIMSQREGLISAKEKLEKDAGKLASQLKDTLHRLNDMEQTRQTYEAALIERNADIHKLEDKLAASSVEISTLRPRAEQLTHAVKNWGHVPWRSLVAGSAAAGAILAFSIAFAERAITGWTAPAPQSAEIKSAPSNAPAGSALELSESAIPKSSAKVEPDSLQLVERAPPDSFDVRDPDATDPGEIAIPDESGAPVSNEQVQFNPDGLPPTDPDSRPPPQDLPPMPQKPRLLLKPAVPPAQQP